jgi:hypothetical protein
MRLRDWIGDLIAMIFLIGLWVVILCLGYIMVV